MSIFPTKILLVTDGCALLELVRSIASRKVG